MRWWERVGAWDDDNRFVVDAVAAGLSGVALVPLSTQWSADPVSPLLYALSALMFVALAWRRARPAVSTAVVYSAALLHMLLGALLIAPADIAVLVALYSVTVHGPVWAYRTAIMGALTGSVLAGAMVAFDTRLFDVTSGIALAFFLGLMSVSVFAFGLVRRARRETIDSLKDRARRLEVERDQQAIIATAAERARIAREMHDIVAHSLSVMIAQADGGRYAAAQDPDAATRSLTTIAETGRAALADMRRLLGVLRPSDTGSSETSPPGAGPGSTTGAADLAPQPGGGEIETLVEQVRSSGVRISLVRMGTSRRLPPGVGLTVHRICQESLTNILKHAGPAPTATVLLQWTTASLVLEVTDDGRGAAAESDGAGHGVLGMRERAVMLGGTLTAGPRPGGGYRVRAEIPIPALEEHQ